MLFILILFAFISVDAGFSAKLGFSDWIQPRVRLVFLVRVTGDVPNQGAQL